MAKKIWVKGHHRVNLKAYDKGATQNLDIHVKGHYRKIKTKRRKR